MYFHWTIIILIPAMLFALYAQNKVSSQYRRYATVRNRRGLTGAQAARKILDSNGLNDINIELVKGTLSDHYDPRKKVLRLSTKVYNEDSIASVSIAAHESGHAIQHAKSYMPLTFRNTIAPIVNIVSTLSWPLLIIGIIAVNAGYYTNGNLIFDLGILFFGGVVVFHAVTLPVEFNASRRAIYQLETLGIIYQEEVPAARKVLSAAAMTYVAALAVAVANLIRILLIRGRE
jgi:Zn-dependent membrane protease YugP